MFLALWIEQVRKQRRCEQDLHIFLALRIVQDREHSNLDRAGRYSKCCGQNRIGNIGAVNRTCIYSIGMRIEQDREHSSLDRAGRYSQRCGQYRIEDITVWIELADIPSAADSTGQRIQHCGYDMKIFLSLLIRQKMEIRHCGKDVKIFLALRIGPDSGHIDVDSTGRYSQRCGQYRIWDIALWIGHADILNAVNMTGQGQRCRQDIRIFLALWIGQTKAHNSADMTNVALQILQIDIS